MAAQGGPVHAMHPVLVAQTPAHHTTGGVVTTDSHMAHHGSEASVRSCECAPLSSGWRSMIALATLAFGVMCWGVYLGGAAASYAMLPHGVARDNIASFSIFLLVIQFVILIASAVLMVMGRAHSAAPVIIPILILQIGWLAVETDKVLKIVRMPHPNGEHEDRTSTWAAGLILVAIANIILLFVFQLRYLRPDALFSSSKASQTQDKVQKSKDVTLKTTQEV